MVRFVAATYLLLFVLGLSRSNPQALAGPKQFISALTGGVAIPEVSLIGRVVPGVF
jgi:hypothetical protein